MHKRKFISSPCIIQKVLEFSIQKFPTLHNKSTELFHVEIIKKSLKQNLNHSKAENFKR